MLEIIPYLMRAVLNGSNKRPLRKGPWAPTPGKPITDNRPVDLAKRYPVKQVKPTLPPTATKKLIKLQPKLPETRNTFGQGIEGNTRQRFIRK